MSLSVPVASLSRMQINVQTRRRTSVETVSKDDRSQASVDSDGIEKLLNRFVFAPLGAITDSDGGVDESAQRSRERLALQARNARFIGEMAVTYGVKEIERRIRDLGIFPGDEAPEPAPASDSNSSPAEPSKGTGPVSAPLMPINHLIANYDDLSASQVVHLLGSFNPDELRDIEHYEKASRNRTTIMNRIRQLLSKAE